MKCVEYKRWVAADAALRCRGAGGVSVAVHRLIDGDGLLRQLGYNVLERFEAESNWDQVAGDEALLSKTMAGRAGRHSRKG